MVTDESVVLFDRRIMSLQFSALTMGSYRLGQLALAALYAGLMRVAKCGQYRSALIYCTGLAPLKGDTIRG